MELRAAIAWLFEGQKSKHGYLVPRWLFLRALALIYFSAFFSLLFQVRGLIGPAGILPVPPYLNAVTQALGTWHRVWFVPSLYWLSSNPHTLTGLCWLGMLASLLLLL